jgi:hypothetical protein
MTTERTKYSYPLVGIFRRLLDTLEITASQIDLICTQPSGEITNSAAEQNGGIARGHASGQRSRSVTGWRMTAVAAGPGVSPVTAG